MRLKLRPFIWPAGAAWTGAAGATGAAGGPLVKSRRWPQPLRLRPSAPHRSEPGLPIFDPVPPALPCPDPPAFHPSDPDSAGPAHGAGWCDDAGLATERVDMWRYPPRGWPDPDACAVEDERLRPLYARVLGLRHVEPGALLCFVFFEGTVVLGFLLALAELVSWWGVLMLPASVALMVKINDVVAASVARSAARVPEIEQERFRRELQPAVGRAVVPDPWRMAEGDPACGPARSTGLAGDAVPAAARVRPELATARTRPRPIPAAAAAADQPRDDRPSAVRSCSDGSPTASGGQIGHDDGPPPVRRTRNNAYPAERARRAPTYLPDRKEPGTDSAQRVRQSAQQRYGLGDGRN